MRPPFRLWLLSLACLAAPSWGAELYRVEMIIFKQPAELKAEAALLESAAPLETAGAIDFRQHTCLPVQADPEKPAPLRTEQEVARCLEGYTRLNELSQPMVQERLRLEDSGQYGIVKHTAWRQPALPPEEARRVRVTADTGAAVLDGTVELSREQFLQLDMELQYRPTPAEPDGDAEEAESLTVRVFRKLRPGEINYMDHPLIGILARVAPIEDEADWDSFCLKLSGSLRLASEMVSKCRSIARWLHTSEGQSL